MNNEQPAITPFELGVITALRYVGMTLARTPGLDIQRIEAELEILKNSLPAEPTWLGIDSSPQQGPLNALLKGLKAD